MKRTKLCQVPGPAEKVRNVSAALAFFLWLLVALGLGCFAGIAKAVVGTVFLDLGIALFVILLIFTGDIGRRLFDRAGLSRSGAKLLFGGTISVVFLVTYWGWFGTILQVYPPMEAVLGTENFHVFWENPKDVVGVIATYFHGVGAKTELAVLSVIYGMTTGSLYASLPIAQPTGFWLGVLWVGELLFVLGYVFVRFNEEDTSALSAKKDAA